MKLYNENKSLSSQCFIEPAIQVGKIVKAIGSECYQKHCSEILMAASFATIPYFLPEAKAGLLPSMVYSYLGTMMITKGTTQFLQSRTRTEKVIAFLKTTGGLGAIANSCYLLDQYAGRDFTLPSFFPIKNSITVVGWKEIGLGSFFLALKIYIRVS